jgi:IS4 transposase
MFILRSLLSPLQIEFKDKFQRGALFVYTLLSIILPFTASRASGLLRSVVALFEINITQRRFYIFMASPKLPWERLWQAVWRLIPSPATDGRILLAADDSINPKTGKKIYGCHSFFDHSAKLNQSPYVWSQNIVKVGLLKCVHGRWSCLPLSWRFYRLQKDMTVGFKTKLEQVVEMVTTLGTIFRAPLLLVTDSWFGNAKVLKPLRKPLGQRIHLLSRLRSNAQLHDELKPPRRRKRGRPRKYGKKRGTAKTLAATLKNKTKKYSIFLYGKKQSVQAVDKILILKSLQAPARIVWVFYRKQWVALFTTDLTLSVEQIIEYYGARWKIESGFKELKQEIGSQQTQARTSNAVTNHLHFCMIAITLSWIYCLRLNQPPPKRYRIKGREHFSFSDIRYAIAEAVAQKEFSLVLNKKSNPKKNNLIAAFLKLAA